MARILICDDAVFMRSTIRDMLEEDGHEVVAEADNPFQVATLYKKYKPELVTMDILMETSGVEGIKQLIKTDPKARIVIVSVLNKQEHEIVNAIKAGALGLVTKPIKKEVLLAEVKRVLEKNL